MIIFIIISFYYDLIWLQPDLRGETNQKTLRGQPVRTVFITQNPLLKIPKSPRNIIKIYKKEKFYHGTRNSFEVLHFLSNYSNGKVFSDNQCGFQASNLWVIELKNISVLSVWFHGLCCPANILGKPNYAYSWRKNTPSTWNHLRHFSNSRYCKTEECSLPGSNRNVSIYCSCYRVSHVWTAVHYQSERCACISLSPYSQCCNSG